MEYIKKLLEHNKKNNKNTKIKLQTTEITLEPTDKTKIHKKQLIIINKNTNTPELIINLQQVTYIT